MRRSVTTSAGVTSMPDLSATSRSARRSGGRITYPTLLDAALVPAKSNEMVRSSRASPPSVRCPAVPSYHSGIPWVDEHSRNWDHPNEYLPLGSYDLCDQSRRQFDTAQR